MKTLITSLLLCLIAPFAWAQNYPAKTVKMVVPFETGTPDSLARILAIGCFFIVLK